MAEAQQEVVLKGIGVSPGVAHGPAYLLTASEVRVVERTLQESEIPREIARFEEAVMATRQQIHEIQERVAQAMSAGHASIFDAHMLVVDDRSFIEEVIRGIYSSRRNVESVLQSVSERYRRVLEELDDDYLRERAADVKDVTRRILRNLAGQSPAILAHLQEPCIIVAGDLAPSDTASMNTERVLGFATDLGSATSHTAIMARALEIPAVVGLHDISIRVSQGDMVLLDGAKGLVILHPTPETLEQYGRIVRTQASVRLALERLRDDPAETTDGYRIRLAANIEQPSDVDAVLRYGAEGIGLFRSEFLFIARTRAPDEHEQARAYEQVAHRIAPQPVVIRTLDIGGDKFISSLKTPPEMNPFLGWRAIRFCLAQPEIFLVQLRAMLRASVHRNVKIMYPMISNADEVVQANKLLEQAKLELHREGVEFDDAIEVGAMIEVPSAALTAHLIAPLVKFFSLGTNDLIQYTMAVDRVNERITYLYEPTHPAILRLIRQVVDVAHDYGLWTAVCGEMASDPVMAPLLLGLGIDELSMSPNFIPYVKGMIRHMRYGDLEDLAARAVQSESASQVLAECRRLAREAAPEIFEILP